MTEIARPDNFDAAEAARVSFLALVALCDNDDELQRWSRVNGFDDVKRIKYGLNRAVILHQSGIIRVIFAGTQTQNWEQWIKHNFQLTAAPHQIDGEVYEGFVTALHSTNEGDPETLFDKVIKETVAMRERHPGGKILFGGHSLGGAMCALAMDEILVKQKLGLSFPLRPEDIDIAYTQGTPRIGNRQFAASFNAVYGEKLHNGVFKNDPVPRVPLREGKKIGRYGITGMHAVGMLHYLDGESGIMFGDIPPLRPFPGRGPTSIHHLPQFYERAYAQLCGIENPYQSVDWLERLVGAKKDYEELGKACENLIRALPEFPSDNKKSRE